MLNCADCTNEVIITKDNSVKYKLGIMVECKCKSRHYVSDVNNPDLKVSIVDIEKQLISK